MEALSSSQRRRQNLDEDLEADETEDDGGDLPLLSRSPRLLSPKLSPRQSVVEAGGNREAPEPAVGAAPTPPRMPWADGAEERPLPLSGRPQNLCSSSTPRTRLLGVRRKM